MRPGDLALLVVAPESRPVLYATLDLRDLTTVMELIPIDSIGFVVSMMNQNYRVSDLSSSLMTIESYVLLLIGDTLGWASTENWCTIS